MPRPSTLKTASILLLLSLSGHTLHAETNEATELDQLLELLEEQTTIATKTRLNADYVPGMVTVLQGDELERNGARNVWEALAQVPGIDLSIEETGRKQVVVRGVGRTYASGNVKILLNGIAMNTAENAYAPPVLSLPVEQVERIEVIRGPGSAIHGEFAYTGVINVITRHEGGRIYGRAGNNNYRGAGGNYSYRNNDDNFSIDLSFAGLQGDGADVSTKKDSGYDALDCGQAGNEPCANYSNAPGPSNEAEEGRSVVLSTRYHDFSLSAQWLEDGVGDHFGVNQYLPPDEKHIVTRNTQQNIEARQAFRPGTDVEGELYIGWQENKENKDDLFIGNVGVWDADCLNDPDTPCGVGDAPFVVDTRYKERRLNAGADFHVTTWQNHQLLLGFNNAWVKTTNAEQRIGQLGATMTSYEGILHEGMNRHINSLTLQDEYRASDVLTLTAGLRHDDYSDVGSSTTPRLAGVWRLSRKHILKAQYAEAFRPPTLYELGSNREDIGPSTSRTLEFGYIYKGIGKEWRLSLFDTHLKDLIVFFDDPTNPWDSGYVNADGAHLYGAELELRQQLSNTFYLNGNISYLQSEDENSGEAIAGSTDWLGNLELGYRPSHDQHLNLRYHYVGDFYREQNDSRDRLTGYNTLDATISFFNLWSRGLTLRSGIKNLTDANIRYPEQAGSYPDDYPRAGREWWLQLGYGF